MITTSNLTEVASEHGWSRREQHHRLAAEPGRP
jgi:hypothetical protein